MTKFSHLHVHTQFSLLDGAAEIGKLYKKAIAEEMPAVAITDHGNMFGVFEFVNQAWKNTKVIGTDEYGKEIKEPVVKPIVGCEFYMVDDRHKKKFTDGTKDIRYHQLLLAKNEIGYKNLCKLCSLGWVEGMYSKYPRIDKELILQHHEGLIASTCCLGAEVPKTILKKGEEEGEKVFKWWLDLFGEDYYVELQRHHIPEQDKVNEVLVKFARKYNVKIIATNDSHYVNQEDANAHDILLCVNTGSKQADPTFKDVDDNGDFRGKRFAFYNDQFFFKSTKQMGELFSDLPEALDNTNEIVGKIKTLNLKRDILLPNFPIPKEFQKYTGLQDVNGKKMDGDILNQWEYLKHLTYEGAKRKYGTIDSVVQERIDFELETIRNMGFPGYFLIVQDFINEAKNMGVFVGPGRGSAAGSAVAYATGITNIDPIKYNLLFERFLNPERVSMPDIDTDFDDEGRGKVIDYVVAKYGKNQVSQIVTYGTMASKTSIQDVSRVLDVPIPKMNEIKGMLVDELDSLSQMLYGELDGPDGLIKKKELSKDTQEKLIQLRNLLKSNTIEGKVLKEAATLEGSVRNTGVHAAGIIIAPSDLTELIPMAVAKDSDLLLTQYEGKVIEDAGVIKMDFLGLKTLTQIRDALELIKKNHGVEIEIDEIPLDDPKTFELYASGATNGTFQFESKGMQEHLVNLKPNKFEDLIAMNALYRPGPIQYIPDFIKRKHGLQQINYDLPDMEEHLQETYGITVYQEQVMLLSQKLAGFTKGDADVLRKAMGKKDRATLDKMKTKFIEKAKEKGHNEEKLTKVWTDWEAFAQYAFNKSHSTCYAFVAYQTAYLKAHYPSEWMASVLNDAGSSEKITFFIEECKRMQIPVLKPNVNQSMVTFSANKKGQLVFGLSALSGLGEAATQAIVEERSKNGEYKNIFDFVKRVSGRALTRKTMEVLAYGGAFDCFEDIHRAQYFATDTNNDVTLIEKLLKWGSMLNQSNQSNTMSLFGDSEEISIAEPKVIECERWPRMYELNKEKEVAGFFLSGHPLDDFKFDTKGVLPLSELQDLKEISKKKNQNFVAIVNKAEKRTAKNGNDYGTFLLEDYTSTYELRLFGQDFLKYKHFFEEGQMLYISMNVQERYNKPGDYFVGIKDVSLLTELRSRTKALNIKMNLEFINDYTIKTIDKVISENKGTIPIRFTILNNTTNETVDLRNKDLKMELNNDALRKLQDLIGVELVGEK